MAARRRLLAIVGPGVLVAATGVGAGDLATGAFSGSHLGVAVVWAVVLGAGWKYLLSEGLTRWQLATGTTLLEGAGRHFGRAALWLFVGYLVVWSYFVGAALMGACGVCAHAILPLGTAPSDKIFYGVLHSAVAVVLVKLGGYRLFGMVMSVCIAVMFVVVLATAVALNPSWSAVAAGLFVPTIPKLHGGGLAWTVALIGGVGGTVTVLCYGYWIREEDRHTADDLRVCRIDLACGYTMTALFGIAMVIIGSTIEIRGSGATLVVDLAERLQDALGPAARWAFLVGAWGAVFSSLLGVWQSVPYLFANLWRLMRTPQQAVSRRDVDPGSRPYQAYLLAIASVPAVGLLGSFEWAQKAYAVVGALFVPLLAVVLLHLNGRSKLVGRRWRNSHLTSLLLAAVLAFFLLAGWLKVQQRIFPRPQEPTPAKPPPAAATGIDTPTTASLSSTADSIHYRVEPCGIVSLSVCRYDGPVASAGGDYRPFACSARCWPPPSRRGRFPAAC